MVKTIAEDEAILRTAFARIEPVAMAVALGSISGLLLFIATAILLLKGASPGTSVGPHLALISIYLPGFHVSWAGAVVGACYFWVIGAIAGFILATLWNLTHHLFIAVTVVRAMWWKMMAD